MRKWILAVVMLLVFGASFSMKIDPLLLSEFNTSQSKGFSTMSVPTKEFLVLYQNKVPQGDVVHKFKHFNVVLMKGTLNDIYSLVQDPDVIFVYSTNHKFNILLNDIVNNTNSTIGDTPEVFSKYNGAGIKIAVIDGGANWSISSLNGINYSYVDFTGNGTPTDHGTFVISEIASRNNTYPGIASGAKILDLDVFAGNTTDLLTLLQAVDYAIENSDVVSMSLGFLAKGVGSRSEYLDLLFDSILNKSDVLFVVAAGNEGDFYSIAQPGSSMYALTVGAVDKNGSYAHFSSKGPIESNRIKPDVCAPGIINAYVSNGSVENWEGTSMATPLVAGAAALVKQANENLTSSEIKYLLMETANYTGNPWECGSGVINVSKAIEFANGSFFVISTSHGIDNYMGYVIDNVSFQIIFFNNAHTNETIEYNVTLSNGTVVNSGNVTLLWNESNKTVDISFDAPNLNPKDSYALIKTNTSLNLVISWAKAIKVNQSNFMKRDLSGSYFYIVDGNAKEGLFDIYLSSSGGLHYYYTVGKDLPIDYQGWGIDNDNYYFLVEPIPPIYFYGELYTDVPINVTVNGFDRSNSSTGEEVNVSNGMVKFESDNFVVTVNGDALPFSCCIAYKDGVYIVDYGEYKAVIALNSSAHIRFGSATKYENYTLVNKIEINGVSKTSIPKYDFYFFNSTDVAITYLLNKDVKYYSVPGIGGVTANIIRNSFFNDLVKIKLANSYNGSAKVYVVIPNTTGVFSDGYQNVVIVKDVAFTNGEGDLPLNIFVPNYVYKIYFCVGSLDLTNLSNCLSEDTVVGSPRRGVSSQWVETLITVVTRFINIYNMG